MGKQGGVKLTTDAQVVSSGGTSLQSQSAAKAALRGRGGAGTAADEVAPAVLGLLGPAPGLLGPVLGLVPGLLRPISGLFAGLLPPEDGEVGAVVSAVHLHRPQVDAQKPFGFVELVLVMKVAEQAPKPFCIAEQKGMGSYVHPLNNCWDNPDAHSISVLHMGAMLMLQI